MVVSKTFDTDPIELEQDIAAIRQLLDEKEGVLIGEEGSSNNNHIISV